MILWPVLFLSLAFADDFSVEEFCFSSPNHMESTLSKAKLILVPSDEISRNGPCVSIKARSHRRDLVQSYIRNLDPNVRVQFSTAELRRSLCELKVEKIRNLNSTNTEVTINNSGTVSTTKNESESKETSEIKTTGAFELTVNQDVIIGKCTYVTANRYDIELEVRKDPKPLIPGVAPGTTVILTNPMPPPDQQTSKLVTTLQLSSGQRVEIGSVVKDLRDKKTQADISPELSHESRDGMSQEKVFLSID
jgi:hypothetical protein